VERTEFIYNMYHQSEIDHLFKDLTQEFITTTVNEVVQMKPKYSEGGPEDTDENAVKLIYAIMDELADRIKAETRVRIELAKKDGKK